MGYPPGWLSAIADGGALVVPLRMNGVTRSVEFRRSWNRWVSASVQTCGFVPVQGASAYSERDFPLPLPGGRRALARFEDHPPQTLSIPADALASEPVEAWSGITIGAMVSFADLFLWCSGFLAGFCKVANDDNDGEAPGTGLRGKGLGRFPCARAQRDSLAWMVTRKISDDGTAELGARAVGPHAGTLARSLLEEIREWDRHGRNLPGTAIAYWLDETYKDQLPGKVAVYRKVHGTATVTWPPSRGRPAGGPQPGSKRTV